MITSIVEFLTARLSEDEQRALDLNSANWTASGPRELKEAEAKRLILRQAKFFFRQSGNTPDGDTRIHGAATAYAEVLDYLAAVYSQHPDYQQEWKP